MYDIKALNDGDKIVVNIFGKERKVKVICTGDNKFDESGHYKPDGFAFNEKELEVLNWLLNNVDLNDYIPQIVEYCNSVYEEWEETNITEDDVDNEVYINMIAVNISEITQSKGGFVYPEISFCGECECDSDGGICIAFRDKKFIGISTQDWTL